MRYMGSKSRIAKYIVPIIQNYINDTGYDSFYDIFCGGCNIIDKIECENKYANDNNKYLIALLKEAIENPNNLPDRISFEEYQSVKMNKEQYPDYYVGLVGFCASFGAKFFGGYARNSKGDNSGDWSHRAIWSLKQQAPKLSTTTFYCKDFRDFNPFAFHRSVIYLDPPYKDTTKYNTGDFPYNDFYNWCEHIPNDNVVLLSEYEAPSMFTPILVIPHYTGLDSKRKSGDINNERTEKLFIKK